MSKFISLSLILFVQFASRIAMCADLPPDLEQNLGRYKGQTVFYNHEQNLAIAAASGSLESTMVNDDIGGTSRREIQESDVYQAGPENSNLLYVLNSYRGLQAIQFNKGSASSDTVEAKLVGREEPTGNYPADMYIVGSRLIVLERIYFNANSKSSSQDQSRLVVYDISNPTTPKLSQIVPFKGVLADSRRVGDVLYVASRVNERWYESGHDAFKSPGYVISFSVKGEIKVLNEHPLSAPISYNNNMSIMEVLQPDNSYKYFLAAVTLPRPTDWFQSPNNFVELVDITDPHGAIQPIVRVPVRGSVEKPSQIILRDGHLIVVSNYRPDNTWRNPARNAVEIFELPKATSTVIDPQEAEFRSQWQKRELRRADVTDSAALEKKAIELNRDPQFGLHGVFVRSEEGLVLKTEPDFVDTRGASEPGLSASLQDVRVDGSFLYVFWVPANRVDPLDLYDISKLNEGPKYLNRTHFDGWIERAFPLEYKGKNYVIGLGQIVASGNNEKGTRTSQAALFEIVKKRGRGVAEFVHQIALTEENGWSQLRGQDKLTTFKLTGDGQGQILFGQTARRGGRFISGGKLVHFDLAQVDKDVEKVFTQGAFLEGSAGYLKRIFFCKDIHRIASLSDQALAIYGETLKTDSLFRANYVLELSRNIRAYMVIGSQEEKSGLQIVSVGNSWYNSEAARTEIRFVPATDPDQEKQPNMRRLSLLGEYQSHELLTPDRLAVLTTEHSYSPKYKQVTRLYIIALGPSASGVYKEIEPEYISASLPSSRNPYMGSTLLKMSEREVVVATSGRLAKIEILPTGIVTSEYKMPDPAINETRSILLLDARLFLYSDVTHDDLDYRQGFLSTLTLDHGEIKIGTPVNIPGQPISLKGSRLITSDRWVVDFVKYHDPSHPLSESREPLLQDGLVSLQLDSNVATLKDTLATPDHLTWTVLKDASLVSLESPDSYRDASLYGEHDYDSPGIHKFHFLSTGGYQFQHEIRGLYANTSQFLTINAIFDDPHTPGGFLGVLGSNSGVRVVRWSSENLRPEFISLNTSEKKSGCENYLTPGMGWWVSAMDYHLTTGDKTSLELSMGFSGVHRVYLETTAAKQSIKP